ncbi:MAG: S8 family serine peptidase [Verrucomicrobia bacterium]|nr:S8 family serine peptidase [Verrucomicrobiota bacterium]
MKPLGYFSLVLAGIALLLVSLSHWEKLTDQSSEDPPAGSVERLTSDRTPFVTPLAAGHPAQSPVGTGGVCRLSERHEFAVGSAIAPEPKRYGEIETTDTYEQPLPDRQGVRRIRLVRANFKYPLLRVEEQYASEDGTLAEQPVRRTVMVADHVILSIKMDIDPRNAWIRLEKMGFSVAGTFAKDSRLIRVKIPAASVADLPKSLAALRETGSFDKAEPDYLVFHQQVVPNDPRFDELWAHRNMGQSGGKSDADIKSTLAWSHTTGSEQVVVAVIDTGVDYEHPDLAGCIFENTNDPVDGIDGDQNGYLDDTHGWNFYATNRDPMDDHFHGTHVAGTIGARGDNAVGVAGVTWRTRILPLKFLSFAGSGVTSDAIAAIRYAADSGARVLNNSWGGGAYSNLLEDAIRYAGQKGCLFVAAAGNDGADSDTAPLYPAAYDLDNILSVAATSDRDELAGFSNFGGISVDLAAPGVGILSTSPRLPTAAMTAEGLPANYATLSGTSMAAPHVSGAAALLLSLEPTLPAVDVKSRILSRGDPIPALLGLCASSSRLNLFNLVDPLWQPRPAWVSVVNLRWNEDRSSSNHDGMVGPSERVELQTGVVNVGNLVAEGSQLRFEILSGRATLENGPQFPMGDLASNMRGAPSVMPLVRIHSDAKDGEIIRVRCTSIWSGARSTFRDLNIPVVKLSNLQATVPLPFKVGEIFSPTDSNLVYFVSPSEWRLYVFDTETAAIAAVRELDPSDRTETNAVTGGLAVSPAGDRLYVALTGTQRIQSFSLPELAPASSFLVHFGPDSLAVDSQGRLYATAADDWSPVRRIDVGTGRTTATSELPQNGGCFYKKSLLRTDESHGRLFLGELELRTENAPGYVREWDTTAALPFTLIAKHPMVNYFMKDFTVDALHEQLLTIHGPIYGVQVTSMASGWFGDVWPLGDSYAKAVHHRPDGEWVLAGSNSQTSLIRRFQRGTGQDLGTYRVMPDSPTAGIKERCIAATKNGRVFYISESIGNKHHLNLIGAGAVSAVVPPIPPLPPRITLDHAEVSDAVGNADNIASPGEIVNLIPTLRNIGASVSLPGHLSIGSLDERVAFPAGSSSYVQAINGGASAVQPAFAVRLDPTIPSGTAIDFTFTYTSQGEASGVFGFRLQVEVPSTPPAMNPSTATVLQFSGIVAHPTQNVVYLVDSRNLRVVSFDTSFGSIRRIVPLPVSNRLIDGSLIRIGAPAVSPDGSMLAVAMGEAHEVQIFSLPDLALVAAHPLDFAATSVAFDAMNRIHATGGTMPTDSGWSIECLDPCSGESLFRYGPASGKPYYLRVSRDGTYLALAIDTTVCLFQTGEAGVPVPISSIGATGSPITPEFARDIDLDPANDIAYVAKGDGKITRHRISDGSELGTWALPASRGCAARIAPGNRLYGVSEYWYGGGVREYDRTSGTPLHDTSVSRGDVIDRGLEVTKNGRVVIISRAWNGSSTNASVDGYDYFVSMLGAPCDLSEPGESPLQLTSLVVSDPPPGNANGNLEPGETVWVVPTIKNVSQQLSGVIAAVLVSSNPAVSIGVPSLVSVPSLDRLESSTLVPMPVSIGAGVGDGENLGLILSLSYGGVIQQIPLRLFASHSQIAHTPADFVVGAMLGHPAKSICYVLDETHRRVVAIDTRLGAIIASAQLVSDPKSCQLALSPDGNHLFVSLGAARLIQILSADTLAAVDMLHVGMDPGGIAVGADGTIYASAIGRSDCLWKINSSTGVGTPFGGNNYAPNVVLRTTLDSARLFVFPSPGVKIDRYNLEPPDAPVRDARFAYGSDNVKDLAIDDQLSRIYLDTNGGIQVTDMRNGHSGAIWPSGVPYGNAVALRAGSPFVYGASGDSYNNRIRRYDRATGCPVADFPVPYPTVTDRGMAITAGEKVVFASKSFTGIPQIGIDGYLYRIGIIGAPSLDLAQSRIQPSVDLGMDRTVDVSSSLQITPAVCFGGAGEGIALSWRSIEGPGTVVCSTREGSTTLSFSHPGRYHLECEAVMGSLHGTDRIWVNSTSIPRISITSQYPDVVYHPGAVGGFVIHRDGNLTKAINVNLSISGTAIPDYGYLALPNVITIPAGESLVRLPVKALRRPFRDGETAEVAVAAGDGYEPGIASSAWVRFTYTSFDRWIGGHKGARPDLKIEPTGDNNGDGVNNVLEYILGRNPLNASAGPPLVVVPGSVGEEVQFQYRAYRASGASIDVQFSPDLRDWYYYLGNEPAIIVTNRVLHDDYTETVTFILGAKAKMHSGRFVRLRTNMSYSQ